MGQITSRTFPTDSAEAGLLLTWWNGLNQNRGDRANLRRCATLDEVLLEPGFHRAWNSLRDQNAGVDAFRLAAVVGVLSHVKEHAPNADLGKAMAAKRGAGNKQVSELRFRRLLKNKTVHEVFGPMIRTVRLLRGQVNVLELAKSIYAWEDDRTKQSLAFRYFA